MAYRNKNKLLCGNLNFTLPGHMNYGKSFLDITSKVENKLALVDGVTGEQITFKEMTHKIMKISMALTNSGLKKGDVIGICSENRIEVVPTVIAILCSGAIATFFNSTYRKEELKHLVKISKPKYLILSSIAFDMHYQTFKSFNMIEHFYIYGKSDKNVDVHHFSDLENNSLDVKDFVAVNFYGNNQPAMILYSSGTTGLQKGVIISHSNYNTTIHQEPITRRPLTLLTVAPFMNTMGLMVVTDSLRFGKTVVFLNKFSEELYLKTIERYKVGILLVAPPTLVTLCKSSFVTKYDTSSLEMILSGGAPLKREVIQEFRNKFPKVKYVLQGYGMTESSCAITKEHEKEHKEGSVGKVTTGAIVKIVDPETQKTLGPMQSGEVHLGGPVVFDGYIGLKQDLDDEGFFKTGDIAYYDEDGFLYVVDRIKELIKYKAFQVSPAELEALLLQHPSILDAAVIGIPDTLAGELPTAFIVKKPNKEVTEEEIKMFIAAKVAPWKQLRGGVRFVNEIPKNPSGKILRRILKQKVMKTKSKL